MHLSAIFIRRPIATSLLMLGIALFGVIAYRALPVSDLPNVDFPTLNVGAGLPGGDPGTMASAVASPLERQFTTIAGLDEMTSSSSAGSSNVTLQFDLGRDIDSAAVDVQTAIAAVMPLLPAGMPAPPSFRKFNPADQPIMFLGLTSDVVPMYVLDDYAETLIAPRISMVSGVSQVQVQGAQKYAVRVQVDPDKLHAEGIGLNEVNTALQNWNVNTPTGQLFGPSTTYNIKAAGQLMNADAFKPVVVAYRHGAAVRLDQIANVLDNVEDNKNASWLYTKAGARRAINLQVMRQPGSNTIEVTDAIRKMMPSFQSQLPPSAQLLIRGDLERCMIVAPGSLVEQWQEELAEKFGLNFDLLTRDQIEASVTGNPFMEKNRLIVRLDMAARSDELKAKLDAAPDWDLIICDEAHRMAASYFGGEVKETRRHKLGKLLGTRTRNLLLMSATPHNGKEADFQLFMGLLDADRFEGRFREGVHKADVTDMMRRMTKEELYRFDGTPLFPERRAYTASYALSPVEADLYQAVTTYVREEMNRADRSGDGFAVRLWLPAS